MINIDVYPRKEEFEHILKLYPLQPANRFLPEWYKKRKIGKDRLLTQIGADAKAPHAKNCPAIAEEILNGIVLPAWTDIQVHIKNGDIHVELPIAQKLWNDHELNNWQWISSHPPEQVEDINLYKSPQFGVLKLMSPYYFSTPKGYGLSFRPMPYHYQTNIRMLPGMVDTDIWHECNFPFEFTEDISNVTTKYIIEAGTPLAILTPYKKKEKYKVNNHMWDSEFVYKQTTNSVKHFTSSNEWKSFKSYAEEE